VIYSGKYLRYGRLIKNKKKRKGNQHHSAKEMEIVLEKIKEKQILQDIKITLGPKVEIVKIIETVNKNWL